MSLCPQEGKQGKIEICGVRCFSACQYRARMGMLDCRWGAGSERRGRGRREQAKRLGKPFFEHRIRARSRRGGDSLQDNSSLPDGCRRMNIDQLG